MKPMRHQNESLKFMKPRPAVLDLSDCGTGKTFVELLDFAQRHKKDGKAMLVLCPKSIMRAAWHNDVQKFTPHLKTSLAYAKNRSDALSVDADIYILNIDGVKDLLKYKPAFWKKFSTIVIDEATSVKHAASGRSKATAKIIKNFEYRRLMTGTPTSNGICDIWHLALLADGGKRLGKSFFGFRAACCTPKQVGPAANMVQWVDRPGIENSVAALLADITIRHKFEDCVDIPENHMYAVTTQLTAKHRKLYNELEAESLLFAGKTIITAINGAVLATKLLQTASGAVYNDAGSYSPIASERYELVLDLVEAREHSVVFYQWEHQLEELLKEARARKVSHVVWDSNHSEIEAAFQKGQYQVLFAHPQSAGHGLTLTRGTATIWASPTYNLEHFQQGLKRIHRIGQRKKTETIVVIAEDTLDERVWASVQGKRIKMNELFEALAA